MVAVLCAHAPIYCNVAGSPGAESVTLNLIQIQNLPLSSWYASVKKLRMVIKQHWGKKTSLCDGLEFKFLQHLCLTIHKITEYFTANKLKIISYTSL